MAKRGLSNGSPCGMQCILPPHMADSVKMRGTAKQRKMVEQLNKAAKVYRDARNSATPPQAAFALASTKAPAVTTAKPDRIVYDGQEKATLPGKVARKEGGKPSSDKTVNEAYNGSGDVFKLYWKEFGRNSLDGLGLTLKSTVHHRKGYNNAFWNTEQMAYGDGDGVIFKKFTELTVIGHELSHGVVQFSGGLIYRDQSGALNESFADVFGSLTEQYKKKQTASKATWLVGKGILGPDISGVALRSMKAPGTAYDDSLLGKDPQPYHMDHYVNTSADNGGVHINSGIPNHAFYLLSQYLGGWAWEKAGKIWYDTLQQINNPLATFQAWAEKTYEVANASHGVGSLEALYTKRAWKLVGINV